MNTMDLLIEDQGTVLLNDVILSPENRELISQLIKEHRYVDALATYGLPVNNKIIFQGASGCGKTMTAKAVAHALDKKIYILNLSNIVNSRIGETAQNLKHIFYKAGREGAVLFLDEFDQIGKSRNSEDKDVGEMRRLVNSLIQLIDYLPSKSLLICATNDIDIIDSALIRRFQLRCAFENPDKNLLDMYYDRILAAFPPNIGTITRVYDVSYAEAQDIALTGVKRNLIEQLETKVITLDKGSVIRD